MNMEPTIADAPCPRQLFDDNDFDYVLGRDELERVVASLLDKGFRRISKLLDDAGFSPEQVALCVATGGMSNVPAVRRRLHELFGPERVEIPDRTATLIAEGAAWIASDKARLHLAKSVELELARNSYMPLVKAGTAMPRAGEVQKSQFHLYRFADRPLRSGLPAKAGSEPWVRP